ncbi:MAG TPA: 4-hydroxy-tetrahydrodipicolinate reductase [Candidatus Eisenbacteria bacterium]
MIPIILFGATGRMGRAIRASVQEFPDVSLIACVARSADDVACPPGCTWRTPDDLKADGSFPKDSVVIDVSLAAGTVRLLEWLERAPRPFVSATTGLDEAQELKIRALARSAAVLRARNLSVGNSVASGMLKSVPRAAREIFDIDLVEHHHAAKRDAPSGTALVWASLLGSERPERVNTAPDPAKPRAPGEIRVLSIRSGTAVGTHRALFAGAGETLEVVHTVSDRAVFARGALRAARYLAGKPPGLYTLEQMLEGP